MTSVYLNFGLKLNSTSLAVFHEGLRVYSNEKCLKNSLLYFHATVSEKNTFSKDINLFVNILSYEINAHLKI